MTKTWMVRAGERAALIDEFREEGHVSIGWAPLGSLETYNSRADLARAVATTWPDWSKQSQSMAVGQLWRFRDEIRKDDTVVTYDPGRRVYLVGAVTEAYAFDPARGEHPQLGEQHPHLKKVRWEGEVSRRVCLSSTCSMSMPATSHRATHARARRPRGSRGWLCGGGTRLKHLEKPLGRNRC